MVVCHETSFVFSVSRPTYIILRGVLSAPLGYTTESGPGFPIFCVMCVYVCVWLNLFSAGRLIRQPKTTVIFLTRPAYIRI